MAGGCQDSEDIVDSKKSNGYGFDSAKQRSILHVQGFKRVQNADCQIGKNQQAVKNIITAAEIIAVSSNINDGINSFTALRPGCFGFHRYLRVIEQVSDYERLIMIGHMKEGNVCFFGGIVEF